MADLRNKLNLFSTAAISGASSATTVKVAVTDPKNTSASKTKSVIHYPIALHPEVGTRSDKSKLAAADMAEITAVDIDPITGKFSIKCLYCAQRWSCSSLKLNKVETHLCSQAHICAVSAKTTSTTKKADVKVTAKRAAKQKAEIATSAICLSTPAD